MATRYHYDLYPRLDPRDGARIRRFTKLQRAIYRDVIGVGSGAADIRSTDAEAADLDPLGEQYIRVVREDTVAETELVVGGWWINRYNHDTAVARQTKRLTFAGAGTMAYLARARMAPHTYMWELDNDFVPQDPFDDIWRLWNQGNWAGGDFLGAVFWRVIQEALHYRTGATYTHRHADGETYTDSHEDDRTGGSAIEFVTLGFDQYEDSDGNGWTVPSGEFQASIGENVLSVTQRLMQAGLYVEMDPDTFELRAWEDSDHRRDRTGGAWGANVVRFQAPTDGTVATGNILSDSEREINSHLKRTLVWAGGGDNYRRGTAGGSPRWEGFESSPATEDDALEQLANTQIAARSEAADAGSIRMKLGTTPLSGKYRPWEEVRLDDVVTVHTGTGEWDYDEATYPVAGLKIELKKSGAWWAWAELGASFGGSQERKFQTAPVASHSHPPNPQLCRPATLSVFQSLGSLGSACSNDGTNPESDYAPWGTDNEERVEITLPVAAPAGTSIVVWVATNIDGGQGGLYPHQVYDEQGNTWTMDDQSIDQGSGDRVVEIWHCNVTNALSAGDYIRFAMNVGSSLSGTSEIGPRCMGAHLFSGALSSPVVGTTAGAFNGSPTIGSSATGGLVVAGMNGDDASGPDADWSESVEVIDAGNGRLLLGQFQIPGANDSYTPTPTGSSHDWTIGSVGYSTEAGGGSINDGHPDLVGLSTRAARCDHRHDVHRDTAPTVNDDWATAGYKLGTIWAQLDDLGNPTEIVGTWMLVDISTGAAVWLSMGASAPAGDLGWFNVTAYGATGDGSTDDTAEINAAIAALNAAGGGVLYFPATADSYLVSAGLDSITVPGIIMGDGVLASTVTCSSATAHLFTSAAATRAPAFRDLSLVNSHATPTAGSAIRVSSGGNSGHYANLRIENFWIGIRHEDGAAWGAEWVTMNSIRKYGFHISNSGAPDEGDWSIDNCALAASTHSPDAAVRIDSSGGGKITNLKVNGSDPTTGYNHGIDLAIAGTDQTSILLIANSSIENVRGDTLHVTQAGTATYSQISMTGCQVSLISNNSGKAASIVAEDTGAIEHVTITGNLFATDGTARTPVALTKVYNADVRGNTLAENFEGQQPYTNSASTGVAAYYPGAEVAYTEFTSNVGPTATAEASANTVVTASAFTFDGQSGWYVEFFCSNARPDVAAESVLRVWLFEDGSSIGRLAILTSDDAGTVGANSPILVRRKLTPSAGSHTYSIRATVSAGTGSLNAGAGGSGNVMPGYIRIFKA